MKPIFTATNESASFRIAYGPDSNIFTASSGNIAISKMGIQAQVKHLFFEHLTEHGLFGWIMIPTMILDFYLLTLLNSPYVIVQHMASFASIALFCMFIISIFLPLRRRFHATKDNVCLYREGRKITLLFRQPQQHAYYGSPAPTPF